MDFQSLSPEDIDRIVEMAWEDRTSFDIIHQQFGIIDRIVEMAWEDRTSFDIIHQQFGITEAEVIKIMRSSMKRSSFLMWRERVRGRKTKHAITSPSQRFKCDRQDKPKQ